MELQFLFTKNIENFKRNSQLTAEAFSNIFGGDGEQKPIEELELGFNNIKTASEKLKEGIDQTETPLTTFSEKLIELSTIIGNIKLEKDKDQEINLKPNLT